MKSAQFPTLGLAMAWALLGCEPSSTPIPSSPHSGTLITIPGEKGYAEFVRKVAEGQTDQVQLVVYFLDPDKKPLATPPTTATFKPTVKGAKLVELKASGDPEASISSPPMADPGEVDGVFLVTIDGKPFTLPVKVR